MSRVAANPAELEDEALAIQELVCILELYNRVNTWAAEVRQTMSTPVSVSKDTPVPYSEAAEHVRKMLDASTKAAAHLDQLYEHVKETRDANNVNWAERLHTTAQCVMRSINAATLFWRDSITDAWMRDMGLADPPRLGDA